MPRADASQSTTPHSPNRSSSARGPGDKSRRERGRKPETISSAPCQTRPSRPSPVPGKKENVHIHAENSPEQKKSCFKLEMKKEKRGKQEMHVDGSFTGMYVCIEGKREKKARRINDKKKYHKNKRIPCGMNPDTQEKQKTRQNNNSTVCRFVSSHLQQGLQSSLHQRRVLLPLPRPPGAYTPPPAHPPRHRHGVVAVPAAS